MLKLGQFVNHKAKILFWIAWQLQTKVEHSQKVWTSIYKNRCWKRQPAIQTSVNAVPFKYIVWSLFPIFHFKIPNWILYAVSSHGCWFIGWSSVQNINNGVGKKCPTHSYVLFPRCLRLFFSFFDLPTTAMWLTTPGNMCYRVLKTAWSYIFDSLTFQPPRCDW